MEVSWGGLCPHAERCRLSKMEAVSLEGASVPAGSPPAARLQPEWLDVGKASSAALTSTLGDSPSRMFPTNFPRCS